MKNVSVKLLMILYEIYFWRNIWDDRRSHNVFSGTLFNDPGISYLVDEFGFVGVFVAQFLKGLDVLGNRRDYNIYWGFEKLI